MSELTHSPFDTRENQSEPSKSAMKAAQECFDWPMGLPFEELCLRATEIIDRAMAEERVAADELRRALVNFTYRHLNAAKNKKDFDHCMHCGNEWTGELHGNRDFFNDKLPPHKEGCPVLFGNAAIIAYDKAREGRAG